MDSIKIYIDEDAMDSDLVIALRSRGVTHAGIILARQQRFSVGEQLRRILRIRAAVNTESIRNRIEFLASWE